MENKLKPNKAKLKYFYLIDTDTIIDRIKISAEYSNFTTDNLNPLFHLMFKEMVNATQRYTSFILSDNPTFHLSFFNEEPGNTSAESSFLLCGLSLFYHCIMHGFKIALINSPDEPKANAVIKITATNESHIKSGFFHWFYHPNEKPSTPKRSAQDYNSLYRHLFSKEKLFNSCKLRYSEQLLYSLNNNPDPLHDRKLFIHNYEANAAYYLFTEGKVKNFNTHISSDYPGRTKSAFINNYIDLYNDAYCTFRKALSIPDQVLFDMTMEPAYHFSTVSYVYTLFDTFYNSASTSKLKYLAGEAFYSILSQYVLQLPIIYNQSIFLKYACTAILGNHSLEATYPPVAESTFGKYVGKYAPITPTSPDSFAIDAIQSIGNFLRMLNYVVLPVLENLWEVLLEELNLTEEITLKHYTKYFEQNYKIMSSDFTNIPDFRKDVHTMFSEYCMLPAYLSGLDANILNASPNYCKYKEKTTSSAVLYNFCTFLHKHFRISQPLSKFSISDLLGSPIPTFRERKQYDTEIDTFQKEHARNLFHFVQMIDSYGLQEK